MYESFYKLRDEPFRLSPDPFYCYKHRSYVKAEGYLRYGVERAEGIVMVTGGPGTGKSTLISDLLKRFPPSKVLIGTLVVTRLEADDLFRAVAYALNLTVEGMDRASVLRCLELFLTEQAQKNKRALLIVDEAQNLTLGRLEDLRLLTNLQMGNRPLLQVFLVGQESLRNKVQDPALKQLLQRIIAACHLEPLQEDETQDYILLRLAQAGWQGDPNITDDAFELIHKYGGGIPRRINQLCSRMFLYGAVDEKHVLDGSDVQAVLEDFRKELLVPHDEQHNLEEIAHAYTRKGGAYQPRIVTASGRPASRTIENAKNEATRPSPPAERSGRLSDPHTRPRERDGQPPSERPDPAPRLQAVSKGPVNDALKALAADDTPPISAAKADRGSAAPPRAPRLEPVANRSLDGEPNTIGPSLYADSRGERRVRGPAPRARSSEELEELYDDRRGEGHPWLKLLLVTVLLLVSIYVASPLIKDQFGIDIAAILQDKVAALTGAPPSPASTTEGPSAQGPTADQGAAANDGGKATE